MCPEKCQKKPRKISVAHAIRPVVGGLKKAYPFQAQVIAVSAPVSGRQYRKGDLCEVFGRRHGIQDNRLVSGQAGKKIAYCTIAAIHQEGMIPCVDQHFLGDAFYIGEIHHHALLGQACCGDDVARQSDLNGVAMTVQMFALAVVAGDAMSGIEFQAAGDLHDGFGQ